MTRWVTAPGLAPVADAAAATVLGPIEGLDTARILGPCVLGHPAADGEERPLVLGPGVVIRAFAVLYQGAILGPGAQVGHGALIREDNRLGEKASVGSGAQLEPRNAVGDRSRIHSGAFLASTTIGHDVFVGPRVVFTDDPHPPCPSYLDCVGGAVVEDGAAIGAGSTIVPGIVLGAGCLVGAGSVVTKSVDPGMLVRGNPARPAGRRDELSCPVGIYRTAYEWERSPG